MNIVEEVQKNLGFDALKKIDPNTQQVPGDDLSIGNHALAQAGIPAVLLGILNRLELTPSLEELESGQTGSLMEKIFGDSSQTVINRIEQYSKNTDKHSAQELEHIVSESLRVIRKKLGDQPGETVIRHFVAGNKQDILLYLPPSLELGTILLNNNLDDRTGKMEGPVSSFMHRLEKKFNISGSGQE
jgi:hypothetical protein